MFRALFQFFSDMSGPEARIELTPAAAAWLAKELAEHEDADQACVFVGIELTDENEPVDGDLDPVVRCVAMEQWPCGFVLYRSQGLPLAIYAPTLSALDGSEIDVDASTGEIVLRMPKRGKKSGETLGVRYLP
jgi:hypothetical protein